MGSNPIILAIRFLLELSALLAMGFWGWRYDDGWLRLVPAIGVPILAAAVWGIFAVPNDPSRSGNAPVATPGILRLLIELVVFGFAVWALRDTGFMGISWVFGIIVTLHYLVSYDRILWLIEQ